MHWWFSSTFRLSSVILVSWIISGAWKHSTYLVVLWGGGSFWTPIAWKKSRVWWTLFVSRRNASCQLLLRSSQDHRNYNRMSLCRCHRWLYRCFMMFQNLSALYHGFLVSNDVCILLLWEPWLHHGPYFTFWGVLSSAVVCGRAHHSFHPWRSHHAISHRRLLFRQRP